MNKLFESILQEIEDNAAYIARSLGRIHREIDSQNEHLDIAFVHQPDEEAYRELVQRDAIIAGKLRTLKRDNSEWAQKFAEQIQQASEQILEVYNVLKGLEGAIARNIIDT